MKNDDGALSFGTAIDMSGFDAGIEQIEGKVAGLTSNVEVETSKISQLLANVPTLNIDVVSNASQTLSTIETAFAEIDRVRDLNTQSIRELEAEYQKLGQQGPQHSTKLQKRAMMSIGPASVSSRLSSRLSTPARGLFPKLTSSSMRWSN